MTLEGMGQGGFSIRIFEKLSVSEPGGQKTDRSARVDGDCRTAECKL